MRPTPSARRIVRRSAATFVSLMLFGAFLAGSSAAPPAAASVRTDFPLYASFQPDDPLFVFQWGLRQIDADQAWDVNLGSRSVVVAVVDTGVWWTHPDIQGNMWVNPADGSHGRDFIDGDTDPMDIDPAGVYHGTGVAGVIAAITDNNQDVAGTAQVSVMALRALGLNGQGSSLNTSEAIRWAADRGAKVINLSLGTNETVGGPSDLQLAIDYAWSQGALIVAAAGNSGTGALDFPARMANVVSVAAIDQTGRRASFSNFGPGLDIAAPGDEILTLNGNDGIHYLRGTSFAAPFVTAAAALLLSVDPTLTNIDLWNILNDTAVQPTGSGYNTDYGWGVVNVWNAINALSQPFVSVNSYPSSVSRSSNFGIRWTILGPASLTVTDTHVAWGTVSGQLGNSTAAQSGMTRQTFTASGLTLPSGANALYFKVVAIVGGTQYESREYTIIASNLPDFLFVLYQLLASNILFLALFIIVLAAIVAFIPQRRAARARRAAYPGRIDYGAPYLVQAARPTQPPPAPPPAMRYEPQAQGPAWPQPGAPGISAPPAPAAIPTKKRCPSCGTMVNADNMFCFFCGNPFR